MTIWFSVVVQEVRSSTRACKGGFGPCYRELDTPRMKKPSYTGFQTYDRSLKRLILLFACKSLPHLFRPLSLRYLVVYDFNDLRIGLCFIPCYVGGILDMYLGG